MNPADPDLKEIFCEALERAAGPDRSAYLDRACRGDATYRLQLESLLRAHDEAGGFLGSSAKGAPAPADSALVTVDQTPEPEAGPTVSLHRPVLAEGPGTTIGPYKLLQQIGEGGMGAVFMAEQEKPVRRRVALKVIKPGMDTGQVVARFEAERQALAIMDHQNIARVLDAGATDTGRPFFVMELVKGVPITEYCDQNNLSPRERLELFIPVCQAIQHAHQKGIIHRDVKPSNVLVTLYDGKPVPKVIDFGVAKAIEQRLTEKTMFTLHGAVVGTLEYMSPEQAEMSALDIDTRSDIYSLGVLLYELLTGSTPLQRGQLRQQAYSEILRRIREEEPPKPSTRLSTTEELPSIAAHRKTEPMRLSRLVRGELDWIVMKSLEKDRTRRYETANGLARDVQRYLDGDPVDAGPPSASYKLRKFARKHRAALVTIGAFALLLVAATAVSAGLAVWANRERARAVKAENSAREQQSRAQDREQMAIDAVKRYGDVVSETPELKNNPGLATLRAKLLKEPQEFFKRLRDRLQADQETTPESLARLASATFALGALTKEIGDKQDALRSYEESLAIRERLAHESPSVTAYHVDLARVHHDIGVLQTETGRPSEAIESFVKARAIRERLARENPSVAELKGELAGSQSNIGALQAAAGRMPQALTSYEQARAIVERLARENPSVAQFRTDLAKVYVNIGLLQSQTSQPAKAIESFEKACAIWERLAADNPSVADFLSGLASTHQGIGNVLQNANRPTEALIPHERARAIRERLVRENPSATQFQRDLAGSHTSIGLVQSAIGRQAEALESFERARDLMELLASENRTDITFQRGLALSHHGIGTVQRERGRPAEALDSYKRALAIRERLAREHPESPMFASDVGGTLNNMAQIDLEQRQFEDARAKLMRAVEWQRKALAANPNNPQYREFLGHHLVNLVNAAEGLGRRDLADQARRELADLEASDSQKTALDARLAAVLSKREDPRNDAERIALAYRASARSLHAASARLFAEAIANDPRLGDDRRFPHRYNAACAAALAGSGRGKDDPMPDEAGKAALRRQACDWLTAELAAWAKMRDTGTSEMKAVVPKALGHWKSDADLAGIRDAKELAKLPEEERAVLNEFWRKVDQLLARAADGK